MSDKDNILKIVSDALNANTGKDAATVAKNVEAELKKAGRFLDRNP